jgi:hypothetical protein
VLVRAVDPAGDETLVDGEPTIVDFDRGQGLFVKDVEHMLGKLASESQRDLVTNRIRDCYRKELQSARPETKVKQRARGEALASHRLAIQKAFERASEDFQTSLFAAGSGG